MKRLGLAILTGSLLAVSACTRTPEPPATEPAAVARATSELGTLELSIDRTEMSTVERVHVTLVLEHKPGVGTEELEFHPEEAGWTVVSSQAEEPTLPQAGIVRARWEFTLEPFLDGDYQIPPATITLHSATEHLTLSTAPEPIKVTSILPDEQATLAAVRAPVDIADERPAAHTGVLVIGVASGVLVIIGVGVAWWLVRRSRREATPPPPLQEQGPRAAIAATRRELMDTLSRRLGPLPRGATTDDIAQHARARLDRDELDTLFRLLAGIDQLAYGPREPQPQDVEAIRADLRRLQNAHQEVTA